MTCRCDSRDLFNYGCRCKGKDLEEVGRWARAYGCGEKKVKELGSMAPSYLLNLPHLQIKTVRKDALKAALQQRFSMMGQGWVDNLTDEIWGDLA